MRMLQLMLLPVLVFLLGGKSLFAATPKTIRVVGVMMEFQPDGPTDNTTGLGTFGSDGRKNYSLDPTPHNKWYFEQHLKFASNYFHKISNGRLDLQYAVVDKPYETYQHLTLPHQMKHYRVPKKQDKESYDEYNYRLNQGIMAFAMDALHVMAKAHVLDSSFSCPGSNGPIRMSDSVIVLVFHAGASGLTDGGGMGAMFADSPSDMIDSYIWPDDFKDYNGTTYNNDEKTVLLAFDKKNDGFGIFSADSSNFFNKLLICSETMSQDDLNFGINGIIVNQLARAMGLPDLWDTHKGVSAVGAFCLMDVGGYNGVSGFVPVMPSAWCRVMMGWVDPVIASPSADSFTYNLPSTLHFSDSATVIKVPLSSTEYYLIENRQVLPRRSNVCSLYTINRVNDVDTNEAFAYDPFDTIYGAQTVMTADSLCSDTPNCKERYLNDKKARGVVVGASSFDFGLPGFGGVLIWHVDEQVIREKLAADGVNNYINRRGVDLEEADGIEDLGAEFVDILGQSVQSYGGPQDFFPHFEASTGKYIDRMVPFDPPSPNSNNDRFFSTHTNTGGYTGISIQIKKTCDTCAKAVSYTDLWGKSATNYVADTFRVVVKWLPGQGNWPQYIDSTASSRELVSVDSTLFTLSDSGLIRAYHSNGTKLFEDSSAKGGAAFSQVSLMQDSILVFAGKERVASDTIFIHAYNVKQKRDAIRAILPGESSVTTPIAVVDSSIYFGTSQGTVYQDAQILFRDSGKIVGSIAANDSLLYAVCGTTLHRWQKSQPLIHGSLPFTPQGRLCLAAGDIDQNFPGIEVLVKDSSGNVALLSSELLPLTGWPKTFPAGATATLPVLGDVDGDGGLDIVVPGNNVINVWNHIGVSLTGWPHTVAKRDSAGVDVRFVSLSDVDNDGAQEVFAVLENGNILLLDNNSQIYEFISGARVNGQALSFGGTPASSCLIKNIDTDLKNGMPEYIELFTFNKEGFISGFNIPLTGLEKSAWQTQGGTLARTSFYQGPAVTLKPSNRTIAVDTFYTFPNPARGNIITAKYKLSSGADKVKLKLFNSAGDRVLEKSGLPGTERWNQVVLDVKSIAPGMYSLKIEAEKNGKSAVRFTKVGVIK